jgi:hypothetical protein
MMILLDLSEKKKLIVFYVTTNRSLFILVRFEFLSVAMMKIQVFWAKPVC